MNEFVEECRRVWSRLGVADPEADEMASELAADLAEGDAQDVLGSDAEDACSFAVAWATERGVVTRPLRTAGGRLRRFGLPAAITAFAVAAIIGAVLVVDGTPSGQRDPVLASPDGRQLVIEPLQPPAPTRMPVAGPGPVTGTVWVTAELQPVDDARDDSEAVGLVLLIAGLTGALALTMLSLRTAPRLGAH